MDIPVTYQLVGICFAVAVPCMLGIVWLFAVFQTKNAAAMVEKALRSHILKVESDVEKIESNLTKIGADVSYIRGRLEPKA